MVSHVTLSLVLFLSFGINPITAKYSRHHWQPNPTKASTSEASTTKVLATELSATDVSTTGDWKKYVRSSSSTTIRPVSVLSSYTVGNVTNADGFLTGNGSTILTRTPATATSPDTAPMIVVDWGQNTAGFLSINFGGASNTTTGLPGIRLAFSETLEFLGNTSDFSRSYNASPSR